MNNNALAIKTILLVNTGSIKKRFILQRLKKLGLSIVCLNKEKNWAQSYVDHWILADNVNHSESIAAVKEFIANHTEIKINGALTFWEDDVLLTSKIIDKFNFIGVPYSIAKRTRNKYRFRQFCQDNNIPTPKYCLVKKEADLKYINDSLEFPVVIKPAFGASSAFVVKVDNQANLGEMYHYVKRNLSVNAESALTDGLDIFVEEFIDGDEVDIDILLQNGKIKFHSISDNYNKSKGVFFVDSGQAIPSNLPAHIKEQIIEMAEMTLEKLGIQNGCIHFEAKYSSKGFYPIEVNLRMGGDYVYSYTKSAWSVDLIEYAAKIACGQYIPKITKPVMPKKYIIGWDLHPQESGILVKLDNLEDLKKNKFVEETEIYKKIGDPILVPPEGYESLGWLTVSGYSMPDAQDNLKQALEFARYDIARFQPASSIGKTLRKNRFSHASLTSNLLIHAAKVEKFKRAVSQDQRGLHIGIACNIYEEADGAVELELMSVGKNIEKALQERGYRVSFFNFNDTKKVFDDLSKSDVDLIFNVCERINNSSLLEPHAVSIFDVMQIPYTGSNPFTLSLCIDKIRVKKLLSYHSIPTPRWDYVYSLDDEIDQSLHYPLIIKPANTDNSIGINNDSVVINPEQLRQQLKKIIVDINRPALIEEYIEGDEYDVSILGSEDDDLKVLPLQRSVFDKMPEGQWHIYTHDAKFGHQSLEQIGITTQLPPKNISAKLQTLLTEIALDTYNILDCHDYGRVEIRVDKDDNPYVLELNPNPSINITDCVSRAAKLTGLDYGDFLEEIIRMAVKRYKNQPAYYHLVSNTI